MDEQVIELVTENLSEPAQNSENPLDIVQNSPDIVQKPAAKKNGRPPGTKDSVKRVCKPRKVTIVEHPLHVEADPVDPVVMKTPKVKAVVVNAEPEIRYVDRYIEHSPRSLVRLAHSHMENEQNSRHNARREHYENQIIGRLR